MDRNIIFLIEINYFRKKDKKKKKLSLETIALGLLKGHRKTFFGDMEHLYMTNPIEMEKDASEKESYQP